MPKASIDCLIGGDSPLKPYIFKYKYILVIGIIGRVPCGDKSRNGTILHVAMTDEIHLFLQCAL